MERGRMEVHTTIRAKIHPPTTLSLHLTTIQPEIHHTGRRMSPATRPSYPFFMSRIIQGLLMYVIP